MRFELTEEQRGIRDALHDLCAGAYGSEAVRRRVGGDASDPLWPKLAEAGWTGIAVAEEHGGQGLGTLELALATEQLGAALAPSAFLGNAAVALLLEGAGSDAHRERLAALASGESRGALAVGRPDGTALAFDADGSALLAVVDGTSARLVETASCRLEPEEGVDLTRRLSRVHLDGTGETLPGDVAAALDRIEITIAGDLLGVADAAMRLAVEYAGSRKQFGRPIGAYQAVSHRCADMLIEVESARSAILAAGWTADHDPENLPFAASVAKATAARAAWNVATSALQVHGGIGFTWEHDVHLYLRRAAASAHLLGDARTHLDRAAGLRGLG